MASENAHLTVGIPPLATKLTRPRIPTALVARERLLHSLDNALAHRLTLLSAAAGWGKTTLLSAWAAHQPFPVAWLSLDELDNEPTRFWAAVIAALQTLDPAAGLVALSMLQTSEPAPLHVGLMALLHDIARANKPAPLVLVLDDYQTITDAAIRASLQFVLERLPTHIHLLLASRTDPDLPLARWRARGELLELRADNLRFSAAEATALFAHALGKALADADVQRLHQRTEGWAAGLQLAALALRQHPDRAAFVETFVGSHRYVLDYVQDEVLDRQPPHVQRFLLHVAVVRRLDAAVCAALTQEPASQALLEELERQNLFVVPLDDTRRMYRFHDLFREVLLAHLHATTPALEPVLHGRAARFYAEQGALREAIPHALAAEDFGYAAELIARAAPELWLRGEAQAVQTWIAALPDAVALLHARLALDAALYLLESLHAVAKEHYADGLAPLERAIARVEKLAQDQPILADDEVALIERRVGLLRAQIAARPLLALGDVARMRQLVAEADALAQGEAGGWKLIALGLRFWLVEALGREGALLIERLVVAKREASAANDQRATLRVMGWLAFAELRAGRLRRLEEEALEALALLQRVGAHSATAGYFHFFLADAYYASNRLPEAQAAVQEVLRIGRLWQQVDLLMVGHSQALGLALTHHDHAAAAQELRAMEELHQQERLAIHAGAVMAARVRYWLAISDLEAARAWAERVAFAPEAWEPNRQWEFLQLVRVELALGRPQRALATLEQFAEHLDRPGDVHITARFLALRVVALHSDGQHAQAAAVALRLLALTAGEDTIRVYLDAGIAMRAVLQRLREQPSVLEPSASAFVTRLLAAFAHEATSGAVRSDAERPYAPALVEPLTPREYEVLQLLAAGASNREIADTLVISLTTAKKHVSNILGKLGVVSRAQAIARVRDLPDPR